MTLFLNIYIIVGTGDINSTGSDMGAFCYLNVPLQDGLRDETFSKIFTRYMYVHVQSYNKKEKKNPTWV